MMIPFVAFFEETHGRLFVPRNLSLDLELNVIDDIRNGDLANFYQMVKKMLQTIWIVVIVLLVKKLFIK